MRGWVALAAFLLASYPASADDRIKIAVVDTGINVTPELVPYMCGTKDFTGKGTEDLLGHGTAIAKLIVEGLDPRKYCILNFKWLHVTSDRFSEYRVIRAIEEAVRVHAKYINLSLAGSGTNPEEQIIVNTALDAGAVLVIAAGNDSCNLSKECDVYPACYPILHPNFHVVASTTRDAHSNYGGPVTDWALGFADVDGERVYGTSFAAPRVLNRLIKGKHK